MWRQAFYVYALVDPRDGCVRYVGLTGQALAARLKSHKASTAGSVAKRRWMAELRKGRLWPEMRVLAHLKCTPEEARTSELEWTAYFVEAGARLLNSEARWYEGPSAR
jgi:hypothetical protein